MRLAQSTLATVRTPLGLVRLFPRLTALVVIVLSTSLARAADPSPVRHRPNLILILADDLGYGDMGCYGQRRIKTPQLDRLAAEGLRFTQAYAGSTVCAPSRCCLMTGRHTGHARVRGNALVPLEPSDVTVAEVCKSAGYKTALIGKWGLGEAESTGVPRQQGFDFFYGYLNQVHAHNYFPDFLWRNESREPLVGNVVVNGVATERAVYSPDRLIDEALTFLDQPHSTPFFLCYTPTLPHANNEAKQAGMEIPSDAPYSAESWPQPQKNHAAMITRLDSDVGRLLQRLKERGLDDNTLVLFSSDNGPHREGGADPAFFASSGPLQGYKRSLHDGGIRVPFLARWPAQIKPGQVSDHVLAFWDVLPTIAQLAGVTPPAEIDGVSFAPTLLGSGTQARHEYLYWEFHESGSKQAVRNGSWKGIRQRMGAPLQLFDLATDVAEQHDVAQKHPDVVTRIENILRKARTEHPTWPLQPFQPAKAKRS